MWAMAGPSSQEWGGAQQDVSCKIWFVWHQVRISHIVVQFEVVWAIHHYLLEEEDWTGRISLRRGGGPSSEDRHCERAV